MTDYVKSTSYALKDSLPSGDPLKIVRGTELDTEFNNIATAISSKANSLSPAFTGTPTAPTATAGTSTTQIATCEYVGTAVASAAPSGSIAMWPTNTAPTGYLFCHGQAVSRTVYAALFAVLGTVFGTGDGSTTFNLPDYRDRFPVGAGTSYAVNTKGGSKDAIVVAHSHTASVTDPGHVHALITNGVSNGSTSNYPLGGGQYPEPTTDYTETATTGISVTVNSAGSSGTNANLPPYIGIQFIIKT